MLWQRYIVPLPLRKVVLQLDQPGRDAERRGERIKALVAVVAIPNPDRTGLPAIGA